MKLWNARENSARNVNEPMWRAFAAKLRDWLDLLLEHRADSPVAGLQNRDEAESSTRKEEDGSASPWKEPDPPEHWLKIVRRGAPGLLRPLEEGGEPRPGTGEPETASGSLLSYSEATVPELTEQTNKDVGSATKDVLSLKNWLSLALRRLLPDAVAQERKQNVAQKRRNQLTSEVRGDPTRVSSQPSAGNSPQEVRSSKEPVVESTSEPMLKRNAGSSPPNREMHSQQSAKEVFANALVKRGTSEGQSGHKNKEAGLPSKEEMGRRSDVDVNRVPSHAISESQGFAWPSVAAGSNPRIAQASEGSRYTRGLRPTPPLWIPLPDNAKNLRNQPQEMFGKGAGQERVLRAELPASREANVHPVDSATWPESEQLDSWPELPEDSRANPTIWRESLRTSDHLRVLDLEQKGGC